MEKLPVWIDCDPGVDDAAAIVLAHWQDELQIVGISTVAGNVNLSLTTANALRICELLGASYPIFAGAENPLLHPYEAKDSFHGQNGLGGAHLPQPRMQPQKEAACDALYEAARRYNGRLELIALGPLTNVALAMQKHPDLAQLLHRIVLMGGSATRGNCTPYAEFNIFSDPDAAKIVFESRIPKVMCGLEVTEQAFLTQQELQFIGQHDSALCRFFRDASPELLRKNLAVGQGGWCVHDVCPVLYCAHPELFSGKMASVTVQTQQTHTLGQTVTDLFGGEVAENRTTLVLLTMNREEFVKRLTAAICAR